MPPTLGVLFAPIVSFPFEYILDFVGPILLTVLMLYLCKAEEYIYGIVLSFFYSLGKLVYSLYHYKKEYLEVDIK